MRLFVICFACLLLSGTGYCQVSNEELTTRFAFHVKSIDDFFDRFNFRRNTGFQNYFRNKYPDHVLTRQSMLINLFDSRTIDSLDVNEMRDFIGFVTDTLNPMKIRYSDSTWYAALNCKVLYKGKPKRLLLVLKVEKSKENAFRWAVVSAKADFLNYKKSRTDSLIRSRSSEYDLYWMNRNKKYSFSPVSHGIDFMNLDNFFLHKENAGDYVFSGHRSFELNKLVTLIQKSELKFSRINTVSYYLFQIEGWILTVDYVNRQDRNSGWLIKKLIRSLPEQKKKFMFDQLNVSAVER